MPKRTYQPKKSRRVKRHGYRARQKTQGGRNVLKKRTLKGRKKLTV
ncbi:50S ribosomal protein L34 [Candidatus Gottesmanbacteria bacterium RIFCSPLOWO2_02_FULL_42_29]|uniref:Large ribosomal subunit protein bL34 n=1 Tax=Candidatus Gottesmanbacteria bacterium RIFCSPLOWO2_01_FULL_42_22 TaxID=1798391 RepID=A0A1F6BJL5_9BACT|nr:MAG: 50S ribosomal protein L34 [Candidatus Gottesmanbacteria bacterium RIFCSPHIGHO2_01_FULL_42_27]OGG22247.1 MAG: 50S ribosomal protein L34 [Candidatus Gottesmanbacteria bacterium RIFCSPHIGHO2_12_FULL_43_26]OGG33211.1 MAG: 50S ribosomal protein L34 [Candidatus Gottesmanbacteria bacterium RIFCSPLOWO2_12_FULL_42_10]OGG37068.1 MAG: 50S ribosomal protein L34 [Candidatus Gottesmanbacteria bacterium RIFCSPLOWO2_01_FULL_42_22]OGG38929.1 MAG: 50S ribosomal protein L34 [Candidatus Gottesmanbacteria b